MDNKPNYAKALNKDKKEPKPKLDAKTRAFLNAVRKTQEEARKRDQ